MQLTRQSSLTILSNIFLCWVIYRYALGGWEIAIQLLTQMGWLPWVVLGLVLLLIFYRSDFRTDLPLFMSGYLLGYWGEWWGTTQGVWTYWNNATPPDYLPPLWAIGLITAHRFSSLLFGSNKEFSPWVSRLATASFFVLPVFAFSMSWRLLASIDWSGRLDIHFWAGLVVAVSLTLYRFRLRSDFGIFLCGTILGALYEALGTSYGEWKYITGETPPWWIAPLWGYACLAMTRLASITRTILTRLLSKWTAPEQIEMDSASQSPTS